MSINLRLEVKGEGEVEVKKRIGKRKWSEEGLRSWLVWSVVYTGGTSGANP